MSSLKFKKDLESRARRSRLVAFGVTAPGQNPVDMADVLSDLAHLADPESLIEVAGISPATLKRILDNNKPYNPMTSTVEKVCKAMGVTLVAATPWDSKTSGKATKPKAAPVSKKASITKPKISR